MRKKQRLFTQNKKQAQEEDNFGMPMSDYVAAEQKSFKDWLSGFDYAERREELQELIKEVFAQLSLREKEVFQLLSDGAAEDQIAAILHIRRSTVHNYRERIIKKFVTVADKTGVLGTTMDTPRATTKYEKGRTSNKYYEYGKEKYFEEDVKEGRVGKIEGAD